MNWFSRGIRSAFSNATRAFALVIILGLSIGLALAMLIAHQAVTAKINKIKASVDNSISIFPAGVRGFTGGGNPLSEQTLQKVKQLNYVTNVDEILSERLSSTETNLTSAVKAGFLGNKFAADGFGGGQTFTPPIVVNGTNEPTNLSASSSTTGGGTFKLKSGSVFSHTSNADVALVGRALAAHNNLTVGSTFTVYSKTIKVVGIFATGNSFGNHQLIMPLTTLQTLSGETNDITSATVYVNSISNVAIANTRIKSILGSTADVISSLSQAQTTISTLQNIETISLYSLIGAVIAGAIIILMTMLMIVRERRREIGIIKAIGSSNSRIAAQFIVEAITLTIAASGIGILIGVFASNPITQTLVSNSISNTASTTSFGHHFGAHRRFSFIDGINHVAKNLDIVHAIVNFNIVFYGLVAALIIAIVGSTVSSYFITKIRPAEVLRTD